VPIADNLSSIVRHPTPLSPAVFFGFIDLHAVALPGMRTGPFVSGSLFWHPV